MNIKNNQQNIKSKINKKVQKKKVLASKVSGVFVEETRHLTISRRQQTILLEP
jgi:hypothetical protein